MQEASEQVSRLGIVCPSSIVCEGIKLLLQVDPTLKVLWGVPFWQGISGLSPVDLVICTVAPLASDIPWILLDEDQAPASGAELRELVASSVGQVAAPIGLTPKELQLLKLLAQGITRQRAARALQVSENTVKSHLGSVYRKLRVRSRTAAVIEALRRGLVLIGGEERPSEFRESRLP